MGIGSKVFVREPTRHANVLVGYQEITTGYGYAGGQPAICHFGLGDRTSVDVTVRLPNGNMIVRNNVAANQTIIVDEAE